MRVEKNIRLLERHAVFMNMAFVIPVIMPFYREEMGLNFRDFLLGEAAFAATVVLLEVPSGWLSDVWQRRWVMVLGTLTQMLGYALLMVADSLVMAALSQSVIGVGISLMSGTNSALLYDSLLSVGREGEYRMREGRRGGLALYSVAGASIVGGFLYAYDHYLPLILSLVTQSVALCMAWQMVEPERHRVAAQKHPVADMIATARYALHGHAEVGLIIVFSAVMFSATKVIMWSQQPYYMAMGLDEKYYGLMMAAGFVLGGLSSQHSHRLDGKFGTIKSLFFVWGLAVAVCIGAAAGGMGWHGVVLLMISGTCIYGMAQPRVSEAINRHVGSERRATVLSTQSLCVSMLFIPLSWAMGEVSERFGIGATHYGLAGWLGIAGICLAVWCHRRNRRAKLLALQDELLNANVA
jgi:MFS family permease